MVSLATRSLKSSRIEASAKPRYIANMEQTDILIAGGGYQHGQVIGATNDKAERPTTKPIGPNDLSAIIYHAVGLKPDDTILDLSDRPTHLLPGGSVPTELL